MVSAISEHAVRAEDAWGQRFQIPAHRPPQAVQVGPQGRQDESACLGSGGATRAEGAGGGVHRAQADNAAWLEQKNREALVDSEPDEDEDEDDDKHSDSSSGSGSNFDDSDDSDSESDSDEEEEETPAAPASRHRSPRHHSPAALDVLAAAAGLDAAGQSDRVLLTSEDEYMKGSEDSDSSDSSDDEDAFAA